ncbi:MAG: hypothetical protein DRI90_10815 [Deltaproteobacteria bacterium]|nr:MAG: hypothetical protein DRI90_10815 [Deltaproteobacteria bacterium]
MASTSIGSYQITRKLGGEDDRYLARSAAGERCQVRVLDLSPVGDWEQAGREVSICDQLDHAAVGKTLEIFEHDQKLVVVFERLDGEPLDRLMATLEEKGEILAPEAVWFIGYQVAGALAQAHSASNQEGDLVAVCHGHLSPQQIAVAWNGAVRLDGLGVAPLVGGTGSQGMAAYVAPEQAAGGRCTPRGDSYSLAVVLWALLAGRAPEPGDANLDAVVHGVPEALRGALAAALEPSLGQRRITSMELEQWLGDVADPSGKRALAKAMAVLRRGRPTEERKAASQSGAGSGSGPGSGSGSGPGPAADGDTPVSPVAEPGRPSSGRKVPPLRSKQATLLGNAPSGEDGDTGTPDMDWVTASESVKPPVDRSELAEEITWGDPDEAEPMVESLSALNAPPSTVDVDLTLPAPAEADRVPDLPLAAPLSAEAPAPAPTDGAPRDDASLAADHDDQPAELAGAVMAPSSPLAGAPPIPPGPTPPSTNQPEAHATVERDGSPWSPGKDVGVAGPTSGAPPRLSLATAIMVTIVTAVLTMVAGVWWVRHRATIAEPPPLPAASGSAVGAAPRRATAAPALSVSAGASASPTVSASAAASAEPAAQPVDGKDGSALPPTAGYLVVKFVGDPHAAVFAAGQKLGPVNQKIEIFCQHPAFLRVGAQQPSGAVKWLTPGRPGVKIACQSVTEITMTK